MSVMIDQLALGEAKRIIEWQAEDLSRLRTSLEWLVTKAINDPCRFDHHGLCQSHFLSKPCLVAEARLLLTETAHHSAQRHGTKEEG